MVTKIQLYYQFFSKDMCLLVLQLLLPAELSLISFVRHYIYICVCVERKAHQDFPESQLTLAISRSLGHINGAWRNNSDTFQ